jgi:hypothetical protein
MNWHIYISNDEIYCDSKLIEKWKPKPRIEEEIDAISHTWRVNRQWTEDPTWVPGACVIITKVKTTTQFPNLKTDFNFFFNWTKKNSCSGSFFFLFQRESGCSSKTSPISSLSLSLSLSLSRADTKTPIPLFKIRIPIPQSITVRFFSKEFKIR